MEIFNCLMPLIIVGVQKKFLRGLNLEEIEHTITEIKNKKCVETFYKDGKIVLQNVSDINKLVGYKVDGNYVFVVFNNYLCSVFDTNTLSIPLDEFVKYLDDIIAQNN